MGMKSGDPHEWIDTPASGSKNDWEIPAEVTYEPSPPSTKEVVESFSTSEYNFTIDDDKT